MCARSGKSASTRSVSKPPLVWIAQGVWMEAVYRGICRHAHRHGWRLDDRLRFSRGAAVIPTERPDGIIAFTPGEAALESAVKRLCAEGVPVVDMEAYADRYGAPKVLGDDALVGRLAATHLASSHPVRLYAAPIAPDSPMSRTRARAFLRRAAELGCPAETLEAGRFRVTDLVRDGHAGLYASGEALAAEILRECLACGVRVPEDLAILSGDDFGTVCENTPVTLSAVDLDLEKKGLVAARLLDRLLRGERPPAKPVVVPPAGIVARESTRLLRAGDARTDLLVRFLRDHALRRAGAAELCREFGMPPRTAQHLLRTKLGATPGEVLREARLQAASRIEASGGLKKDALARAAGYASRSGLARARRKAAG